MKFFLAVLLVLIVFAQAAIKPETHKKEFDAALKKFSPIIYIHKNEKFFPTPLDHSCKNTFTNVPNSELLKKSTKVHLDNYGYRKFDNNAPLYVKVKQSKHDKNKWWFIYAIWQAFNDCGPDARLTATIGGIGLKNDKIPLCPGGVHEGDWEHVTVEVDSTLSTISRVYIAYHSFGRWYKPSQLHMEAGHPTAYMAKGSHALYRKPGAVKYMELFKEKTSQKILPCGIKLCKKSIPCNVKFCSKKYWGVKVYYPCGIKKCSKKIPCGVKLCNLRLETSGYFQDYPPKSRSSKHSYRWHTSNIKWVMTEDMQNDKNSVFYSLLTGVSDVERKMSVFVGRGGQDIINDGWRKFEKYILAITWPVRKLKSSADKKIKGFLEKMGGEYESTASSGLGQKSWFEKDGEDKDAFSTDI
eukprot:gene8805-753_t